MYEGYFGLLEAPFALTPDPAFLYRSRHHNYGLLALEYGIVNRAGFSLLTGEVGSGKTLLVRKILASLGPQFRVGLINNTSRNLGSLLQWICLAFGLDYQGKSPAGLYHEFVNFLIREYTARRRVLLVVDEAQNLDAPVLEELRVLSNVNADKHLLLQTVLVGQPELRELLRQPRLRQFAQRISSDYHLPALRQQDAREYVQHRLIVAGGPPDLIRVEAVDLAWQAAGGIPRLINQLCDLALVYAYGDGQRYVDSATMQGVVADRSSGGLWQHAEARALRPPAWAGAFLLLLCCALAAAPALATSSPGGSAGGDASGGISAATLAVIINLDDPQSVAVGRYYQRRRGIPEQNLVRVRMRSDAVTLSEAEFARVDADVQRQAPGTVQAYALTWLRPYRVACMSITTAFAVGFDRDYCSDGCQRTRYSRYFDSWNPRPATELGIRPTMSIAAVDFEHARALIDRGVAADGTAPKGTAWLVETDDAARNVRAARYRLAQLLLAGRIDVRIVHAPALHDAPDVMFYFLGAMQVPQIDSNHYLPGAVADHLTSTGGALAEPGQMSALRWLEAGATGSYGTVVEPCNFPSKFPDPATLMKHYVAGETLIEAYWKSVAMPGQGVFIGEPLARPYR